MTSFNSAGYTSSFGFQWQKHAKTQLDKFNGTSISRERFFRTSLWQPDELSGKLVLEIGSGAGRFTQIVLDAGARVVSLEASKAVFANAQNNPHQNLLLVQASLYDQPFVPECFDYMFCLGVIQHTPDVERAFKSLFGYLKKGGKFCVDVYASPISYLHPRHLLRPFTRKMAPEKLYQTVCKTVPALLPISNCLQKIPGVGEMLARLVPVANWNKSLTFNSPSQLLEWSILDTFDWYSPAYEKPQTRHALKRWCEDLKLQHYEIARYRGINVVRGTK